MIDVEEYLKSHQITYILHEHPAVFTCEEAEKYCGNIPGMACKNLLLKGKTSSKNPQGHQPTQSPEKYFLLILPANKRTDLKKFAQIANSNKISFASPEALQAKLGLTPGAVSLFGILNDTNQAVELYIDKELYNAPIVSFHPNRNTATLELSHEMLKKFLSSIVHKAKILEI